MKKLKCLFLIVTIVFLLVGTSVLYASDGEIYVTKNNELEDHNIISFGQAPEFAKMVAEGELLSVEERLPKEPFVVAPYEDIGVYGGTVSIASTSGSPSNPDAMLMDGFNGFVLPTPQADDIVVNFAKKIESSADKTTWTFYLRKGVKWSDGEPFTTDDILFWYEDILLNEELTPAIDDVYKADGKVMDLTIIDKYTFQLKYAAPQPYLLNYIPNYMHMKFPKHYLKNFHPEYTTEEELQKKVKEAGYDHWYELFNSKNEGRREVYTVIGRPVLTAYKIVINRSDRRVYERNPYYWKVDTEGNQLPYFEKIELSIFGNREVITGKIMSGEIDFAGFNTSIQDYSLLKKYEDEGNYNTILWNSGKGNDVQYMVNMTHKDPVLREIFQDVRFRRALSIAIDRDEINEIIYHGRAEPRQAVPVDNSIYLEPGVEKLYTEYNPEKASQLLDEMGLEDSNGDGWRERLDGKKLSFTIEFRDNETPKAPNVELVVSYWKEIGIDVSAKQISNELQRERAPANLMDATTWHAGQTTDKLFPIKAAKIIPVSPNHDSSKCPEWARWFQTNGEKGEEPIQEIKDIYNWWQKMNIEPDKEKRIEYGRKIVRSQAENLWTIGTVGNAPHPVIVSKKIGNAPPGGMDYMWAWDTIWSMSCHPEQMYFKE